VARYGPVGLGAAWQGIVRYGRHGEVGQGVLRRGEVWPGR
jgi:hypothetical protein